MLALVSKLSTAARRLLIGRPFRSDKLAHTLVPKRIALPVFASDALSSVAYAPEEIFLVLSVACPGSVLDGPVDRVGGGGGDAHRDRELPAERPRLPVGWWRLRGGDDESRAHRRLVVASALLVDYALTVAVSMSSAISNMDRRCHSSPSARFCSPWLPSCF